MCGIVGLYLKNPALRPHLGRHLTTMLIGMTERGPDSAGIAVYHKPVAAKNSKLTLFHPDPAFHWREVGGQLGQDLDTEVDFEVKGNHAVMTIGTDDVHARDWLRTHRPEIRVMGYGRVMEVYKDMGLPADVAARYGIAGMEGAHAIGHTRMATESAVTTEHSHPFTAASDMCLVHNGSLSNHNNMRKWLKKRGHIFETDNDSEVAARYFAQRLSEGASLSEAMEAGLADLDGFYTFMMGTRNGFAVLRDAFACKPAVLAETDDWVAMASEYRALAVLPGADKARVWAPAPAVVYTWEVKDAA